MARPPGTPRAGLPVASDLQALLARLSTEERTRHAELAGLEERLRRFEDIERPAYSQWLRLALGPVLMALEARYEELRVRRAMAERVAALVDLDGWHPREALYAVLNPGAVDARAPRDRMDPDEVAARRRAKVDRKRAERKAARQPSQRVAGETPSGGDARARVVSLYRSLARLLHPDSPRAIRSLDPQRVRAIWAEVQTAYDADNFERLLSLAAWLETVAEANADTDPSQIIPLSLAERFERLRALARSARTLERRLAHLESDPAWEFPSRRERDRRRLRSDAARALDEELLGVAEALAGVEDFFESIGSPRPPRGTGRR